MNQGKIRRVSSLLAAGILCAACSTESRPSPLPDLRDARVVVVTPFGDSPLYELRQPADSLRIAMLGEALNRFPTGWTTSTDDPPHPNIAAAFLSDSTAFTVLWIGPGFIAGSGLGGGERLAKRVTRTEELHLRALLDVKTVIGTISDRPPLNPPQN